ncbi:hypothetical protein [Methylobacterium sp. J-068]|uniref:hypothetical protein n=1 Tax=Methylobacterium sp. J-068 TaxID=2836649 RepID=UPI001FBAC5F1|nr:hypothetical protein [Methylobacterium sp. J-068]MCJ2035172.1 hypothetical protein [Methylobacterium sp. J-068]
MMSRATRAGRARTAPLRAVTAVIALYAFILHAVLGGLAPLPSVLDHGVLCLGQIDGASADPGDPAAAHHGPAACCTVPSALGALLPEGVTQPVSWPRGVVNVVDWRTQSPVSARGPPGTIAHPRGPPTV